MQNLHLVQQGNHLSFSLGLPMLCFSKQQAKYFWQTQGKVTFTKPQYAALTFLILCILKCTHNSDFSQPLYCPKSIGATAGLRNMKF